MLGSIIFISFAGALFPLVACSFFDVPLAPGFFCFALFLIFALFFCKRSFALQVVISIPVLALACISRNLYEVVFSIYFFLLIWASFWSFVRPRVRAILCGCLSLFVFICGWSIFFEFAFSMSLGELWGVAKFFWWGIILFILVPFVQLGIVYVLCRRFLFRTDLFIHPMVLIASVAVLLGIHFVAGHIQSRQPILDFPVYNFIKQQLQPGRITQSAVLRQDVKREFSIASENQEILGLDSLRPTVMVLVESWGLRKDFQMNKDEFTVFDSNDVTFKGVWRRQTNFTQGAEYEDFGMPKGVKSGATLMERYRISGYDTWFVHGYNGKFYERKSIYDTLGFGHTLYQEDFAAQGLTMCDDYGFAGVCDSSITKFLDSLLSDSIPKFVYWTTLDSHPPYETQKVPENEICKNLNEVECIHGVHIHKTLTLISELAQKHPRYRFVIRGDHRPMGSLTASDFVTSFYHSWVPVIVLNFD